MSRLVIDANFSGQSVSKEMFTELRPSDTRFDNWDCNTKPRKCGSKKIKWKQKELSKKIKVKIKIKIKVKVKIKIRIKIKVKIRIRTKLLIINKKSWNKISRSWKENVLKSWRKNYKNVIMARIVSKININIFYNDMNSPCNKTEHFL